MKEEVSPPFHNRLGIAVAMRCYQAQREPLASERWRRLAAAGARPQHLLWASTGTKDPAARLQREGVQAFAKSWRGLLARIREKSSLQTADAATDKTTEQPQ